MALTLRSTSLSISRSLLIGRPRHVVLLRSQQYSWLSAGNSFRGQSGTIYRLDSQLGTGSRNNVWLAVDSSSEPKQFVAKGPSISDDKPKRWPAF